VQVGNDLSSGDGVGCYRVWSIEVGMIGHAVLRGTGEMGNTTRPTSRGRGCLVGNLG
jgi:hypothetical protein